MRRTLATLFALSLLAGPAAVGAHARTVCAPPGCLDVAVPYPSTLKVPDSHVRILLPARYRAHGPGYPVLYLLHGAGDTYRSWAENTDLVKFSDAYRVIVVMPDGGRN